MRNLGARPGLLGPGRELCWSVMFPKMGAGGDRQGEHRGLRQLGQAAHGAPHHQEGWDGSS